MDQETIGKTQKKLDQVSSTFCLAKWKNSTIHLHSGHTQSCHHVMKEKFFINKNDPSKIHNSPKKIKDRKKMLAGKQPTRCNYCWKVENLGQTSDRVLKSANPTYMDKFDEVKNSEVGKSIAPSYLEISFDKVCQFACAYCEPAFSTTWEKEVRKFGYYPTISKLPLNLLYKNKITRNIINSIKDKRNSKEKKENNIQAFWNWWPELKKELKHLRVTGGEPFLSRETHKLFEHLISNPEKDLEFSVNSNMGLASSQMQPIANKLSNVSKNVKHLSIYASIDTLGKRAEYIRHGLNEKIFWENTEVFLKTIDTPISMVFMVTVNIMSLVGLEDLLKKISELSKKYPLHNIRVDTPYLRMPSYLSIEMLPQEFGIYPTKAFHWMENQNSFTVREKQMVKRLASIVAKPQNPFKQYLFQRDFNKFITEYDRRKNSDFNKTFPELASYRKNCQQGFFQFLQSDFFKKRSQRALGKGLSS